MTEPLAPSAPSGLPLRFASDAVRTRALRFARLKPSGCPSSPLRFAEGYGADGGNGVGSGGDGRGVGAGDPNAPQRTVIDEDHLKRMMRENDGFLRRNSHQLVTLILIAVTCVVYLAEVVLSGLQLEADTQVLIDMGAMIPILVQGPADLWRFVTPMFLHMDLMHLLFNMVALYSVGMTLERILGKGGFLALYFVSGITGNVASYAWGLLAEGGLTVSAGASTSVFGLFVAVALLAVLARGNRRYLTAYSKGMLAVILVNVAYSLLVPGISISGHLGGAVGGAIAMLMIPSKNLRTPKPVCAMVTVLWIAGMTAAIWWGLGEVPTVAVNLLAG